MIGREGELNYLQGVVADVTSSGRAVLISGETGIGKTTLVDALVGSARTSGIKVLRCTGIERERTTGYIALYDLVRPVLSHLDEIPGRQRAALGRIFGLGDAEPGGFVPEQLLTEIATVSLIEEAAALSPLLLVVEDLQWLDPSSAAVIAFLARQLELLPAVLIATARTEQTSLARWTALGMLHLTLARLNPDESEQLLDELADPPRGAARRRVLNEAEGNPLALRELAAMIRHDEPMDDAAVGVHLPLSQRIQHAFLEQVTGLPVRTQRLLLLAAAGGDASLSEVLQAGEELGLTPADLDPAERTGLVTVFDGRLRFRHPVLSSEIYSAGEFSERLQAHRSLATTVRDAGRAAWHGAAGAHALDEKVARALTDAAERARHRGAHAEAAAAFERAAALSVCPAGHVKRMVEAAEAARLAGRPNMAARLSAASLPLLDDPGADPAMVVKGAVTRWRLTTNQGQWTDRARELVDLAERLAGPEGSDHVAERTSALSAAAIASYVLQPHEALRARVREAVRRLGTGSADAEQQVALVLTDPLGHAHRWRGRLPGLMPSVEAPNRLASAAEAIQDLPAAAELWSAAVARAHRAREVSEQCLCLAGRGLIRVLLGDLSGAISDAELAQRIAGDACSPSSARRP